MQGGYSGFAGPGMGGPGRQIYIANVCAPAEQSLPVRDKC